MILFLFYSASEFYVVGFMTLLTVLTRSGLYDLSVLFFIRLTIKREKVCRHDILGSAGRAVWGEGNVTGQV